MNHSSAIILNTHQYSTCLAHNIGEAKDVQKVGKFCVRLSTIL